MSKMRIVVVGNGMVGHNFLTTLARSEHAQHIDLLVFSEEPRLAYDRVQLSSYFSKFFCRTRVICPSWA